MEVLLNLNRLFLLRQSLAWTAFQVLIGSLFLAACSSKYSSLPSTHDNANTWGFHSTIMQGRKKASYSALFYLAQVSLGLPVLANGSSNAAWFTIPTAGYLVAFPIAAYVIGKLISLREKPSALWVLMSVFVGQVIIYTL